MYAIACTTCVVGLAENDKLREYVPFSAVAVDPAGLPSISSRIVCKGTPIDPAIDSLPLNVYGVAGATVAGPVSVTANGGVASAGFVPAAKNAMTTTASASRRM